LEGRGFRENEKKKKKKEKKIMKDFLEF